MKTRTISFAASLCYRTSNSQKAYATTDSDYIFREPENRITYNDNKLSPLSIDIHAEIALDAVLTH